MASQVNELQVWDNMAPVVNAGTDSDFESWTDMAPDVDRDEGFNPTGGGAIRRRVVDF
jgi:hypothetical protein